MFTKPPAATRGCSSFRLKAEVFPFPIGDNNQAQCSAPQRANAEIGDVLEAAQRALENRRLRLGAEGHAEHDPQLVFRQPRHFVKDPRALEHDQRVGRGGYHHLPIVLADHQLRRGQAIFPQMMVDQGQQHGEVATVVEVVIVMPADVIAGAVVEQQGAGTLIMDRRGQHRLADDR